MDANELESSGVETNLELKYWLIILVKFQLIDNKLKFDHHINKTVNKSNQMVGMITHYISFKTGYIMVPLFKTLTRPVLEYGHGV